MFRISSYRLKTAKMIKCFIHIQTTKQKKSQMFCYLKQCFYICRQIEAKYNENDISKCMLVAFLATFKKVVRYLSRIYTNSKI